MEEHVAAEVLAAAGNEALAQVHLVLGSPELGSSYARGKSSPFEIPAARPST